MKRTATTRPFPAKQYGKCPLGVTPDGCVSHPIHKGDMIVRLDKRLVWHEEKAGRYGKIYLSRCTSEYVHAKCLEEYNEWKMEKDAADKENR